MPGSIPNANFDGKSFKKFVAKALLPSSLCRIISMRRFMKTITVVGSVDEHHRLQAQVLEEVPSGPVHLEVLVSAEDEAGIRWTMGLASVWDDHLAGARRGIVTLDAGKDV